MSKELEALEEIGKTLMFVNENTLESKPLKEVMPNYYGTIKKALERLESIDNAKPSEALECLKSLEKFFNSRKMYEPNNTFNDKWLENIEIIKQALTRLNHLDFMMDLLPNQFSAINNREIFIMRREMFEKYQEQEKALEILKSKKYIPLDKINPKFWNSKKTYNKTVNYEFYLWLCEEECEYVVKEEQKLTEKEFDLLKRWANGNISSNSSNL